MTCTYPFGLSLEKGFGRGVESSTGMREAPGSNGGNFSLEDEDEAEDEAEVIVVGVDDWITPSELPGFNPCFASALSIKTSCKVSTVSGVASIRPCR